MALNKIKALLCKTFSIRKSFWVGLQSAIGDTFGVILGAAIAALMTLLTYKNPTWMGFISYIFAIVLLLIGFLVSRKYPSGYFSSIAGTSIASFLCVVASIDVLKAMSGMVIRVAYWETPLESVPSFFLNNAELNSPGKTALLSVGIVFVVLLAHKWFDSHRAMFYNKGSKADS